MWDRLKGIDISGWWMGTDVGVVIRSNKKGR